MTPRWGYDTISVSSPDQDTLRSFGEVLVKSLEHFIVFDGIIGRGKDQEFNVISVSEDCPPNIINKIKIDEQKH